MQILLKQTTIGLANSFESHMLQSSKRTGAKQNLTQNGHSRSLKDEGHVFWSQWKGDKGLSNTKY